MSPSLECPTPVVGQTALEQSVGVCLSQLHLLLLLSRSALRADTLHTVHTRVHSDETREHSSHVSPVS